MAFGGVLGLAVSSNSPVRSNRPRVLLRVAIHIGVGGHVEAGEQLLHGFGEAALILDGGAETIEIGPGAVLDPLSPQLDDGAGVNGRGRAGQALAHHHGDGLVERRVLAAHRRLRPGAGEFLVEHGVEIGGDAFHAPRADGLDAGLLDRIEYGAGRWPLRDITPMHGVVVAGETQRHRIGVTTQHRGGLGVELARRLGQAGAGALAHADKRRLVGSKAHLQRRRAGERAHGAGDGALEGLLRGLASGRGLAVGQNGHAPNITAARGRCKGNAHAICWRAWSRLFATTPHSAPCIGRWR
jgi:hypothetical protein